MLDDRTGGPEDDHLQSIAHGVVMLEQLVNQFGAERGGCASARCAAWRFAAATTTSRFARAASTSFPASSPAEHPADAEFVERDLPSGNAQLDGLLGGGLPAGTSTLLLGPAGTGKSTIATQFATAAAARGERAAIFVFDENIGTFRSRSRKLGIPVDHALRNGLITLQQIDPAELSSGEFAAIVRRSARVTTTAGSPRSSSSSTA